MSDHIWKSNYWEMRYKTQAAEIERLAAENGELKSTIKDNLDSALFSCGYYSIEPSKAAMKEFQKFTADHDADEKGQ